MSDTKHEAPARENCERATEVTEHTESKKVVNKVATNPSPHNTQLYGVPLVDWISKSYSILISLNRRGRSIHIHLGFRKQSPKALNFAMRVAFSW